MGLYPDAPKLPCVVGYEVSGVVDALGEQTSGFALGDRVIAMCYFGGYSELVTVPSSQALKNAGAHELRDWCCISGRVTSLHTT